MAEGVVSQLFRKLFKLEAPIYEPEVCPTCEVLKIELAKERARADKLIDKFNQPATESIKSVDHTEAVPRLIKNKHTPWPVRRQQLEREDAVRAEITKNLEKELDIPSFEDRVNETEKVNG